MHAVLPLLLVWALQGVVSAAAQPLLVRGRVAAQGCPASDWKAALLPQPAPRLPAGASAAAVDADGRFELAADAGPRFLCLYLDGVLDPDSVLPINLQPNVRYPDLLLKPAAPRLGVELVIHTAEGKPLGQRSRVHLFNPYGWVTAAAPNAEGVVRLGRLPAG
ncbi:MAG: hypothetical protein QHJ73_01950, partial [Armatimonadota bacterium]|nr:hypothetical protein [Armatimonadota bacterium]